ncbi:hypothetical protein DRJ22_05145 [Candidatus Woesearchaeota archaeon]|nr:MAG: hypothetical protein DRJ22_05145 [Candidatus Woesearchaeota archaeon]
MRKKLIITGIAVVVILSFSFLFKGQFPMTGFVSANTFVQKIDTVIEPDTGYILEPVFKDDKYSRLSSLRVSGKIYGTGVVKIYVKDDLGDTYLVYSNQKVKSFNRITGFMTGKSATPQTTGSSESELNQSQELPFVFKQIKGEDFSYKEFSPESSSEKKQIETQNGVTGLVSGSPEKTELSFDVFSSIPDDENRPELQSFDMECVETCAFFSKSKQYQFIFEIEKGTFLKLTKIVYTLNEQDKPLF